MKTHVTFLLDETVSKNQYQTPTYSPYVEGNILKLPYQVGGYITLLPVSRWKFQHFSPLSPLFRITSTL